MSLQVDRRDPLRTAQGVGLGVLISVPLWVLIIVSTCKILS